MMVSEIERKKLIEANRRLAKSKDNRIALAISNKIKLTKSAERDIADAIASLPEKEKFEINAICAKIVDMNYDKFVGQDGSEDGFDYQMKRKRFETTGDIQNCIAVYLSQHAIK